MNKKIIFGLILMIAIVVMGSVIFIINKEKTPSLLEENNTQEKNQNIENDNGTSLNPETPNEPLAPAIPTSVKDTVWDLFQKYLAYNKELDLDGVKSVVHKVSDICNTEKPTEECKSRMSSAYSYGNVLEKEEFVNVWQDEKQLILSTDFWTEESKDLDQYGRFRAIIFFIKDEDNNWKLLSFSPFKGKIFLMGSASREEFTERAVIYTEDNDKDGKEDYLEECLSTPEDSACLKTDPKQRDTDGDGWWDGIEILLN